MACHTSRVTPEQQFWRWFQANEAVLFDFETDQERIFDQVLVELHKVNRDLTFEFGPKKAGRREFIISADGIRAAFPTVESLYAAAPALPRWNFIKFRPRKPPFDISYGGISIKANSVLVHLERSGPKANLVVYLPGYSDSERSKYIPLAFLFLDQALGEYDVETYADKIDTQSTEKAAPGGYSLKDLPSVFDKLLERR